MVIFWASWCSVNFVCVHIMMYVIEATPEAYKHEKKLK